MKRLNPDYVEVIAKKVNGCPYFALVSMGIINLEWGQCRIEVIIQEKHLQPFGMVHGGVYASLVDAAAFWAVYTQIDEDVGITTVEIKLNYLNPASEGYMIATGKCIKIGRTLCLGETSIEDERGRLLAYGTATMMILKDMKIQGDTELQPKFLE